MPPMTAAMPSHQVMPPHGMPGGQGMPPMAPNQGHMAPYMMGMNPGMVPGKMCHIGKDILLKN